jgi:hypothetical protein
MAGTALRHHSLGQQREGLFYFTSAHRVGCVDNEDLETVVIYLMVCQGNKRVSTYNV